MFRRSDVRLICFKLSKGGNLTEEQKEILPFIEEKLTPSDSWENFTKAWDLIVKPEEITRVAVEKDEVFVNDFCVSVRTQLQVGVPIEEIERKFTAREQNIYDIIKLNYLGSEVDWSLYKKEWDVKINLDSGRLEVSNLRTKNSPPPPKPSAKLRKAIKEELNPTEDSDIMDKLKALLKKAEEKSTE